MPLPRQLEPTAHGARASGLISLTVAAAATLALSLFLTSRSASPTVLWIELRTDRGEQRRGTDLGPACNKVAI